MEKLLLFREQMKELYKSYGVVITMGMKFLAALVALLLLSSKIGGMAILQSPLIIAGIALLCAVLPQNLMVLLLAGVMTGHIFGLSMEVAALVLIVLILMFLLYFRFSAGDGMVLVLLPVLFVIKIPFVLPLAMGLLATPFSVVSVAFATVLYFMLNYIHENAQQISNAADGFAEISAMVDYVFLNQQMYLLIIVFSLVLIAVYIIRKLSIQYSWIVAVGVGTAIQIIILMIGEFVFRLGEVISVPMLIVGNIVSLGIGIALCYLFHHVDYKKTEHVQFEDDNYYYYVKAVPKVTADLPKKAEKQRRMSEDSEEKQIRRPMQETQVRRPVNETGVRRPMGETQVRRPAGQTDVRTSMGETQMRRSNNKTQVTRRLRDEDL